MSLCDDRATWCGRFLVENLFVVASSSCLLLLLEMKRKKMMFKKRSWIPFDSCFMFRMSVVCSNWLRSGWNVRKVTIPELKDFQGMLSGSCVGWWIVLGVEFETMSCPHILITWSSSVITSTGNRVWVCATHWLAIGFVWLSKAINYRQIIFPGNRTHRWRIWETDELPAAIKDRIIRFVFVAIQHVAHFFLLSSAPFHIFASRHSRHSCRLQAMNVSFITDICLCVVIIGMRVFS